MKIMFIGKNSGQSLKASDPTTVVGVAQALGHEVIQSIDGKPEIIICVDFEPSATKVLSEARESGVKTVLIANEPAVVIPQHAQQRTLSLFDKVIFVGRPNMTPFLKWPQTWAQLEPLNRRLDRAVIVNADKWSFVEGQHYWLRAALAKESTKVDVFGQGWSRAFHVRLAHRIFEFLRTFTCRTIPSLRGFPYLLAKPLVYLGAVDSKVKAMSAYKVAVVIENSSELVTEKLFDAWFAGCVPVYVGPKLSDLGLPIDLVVAPKSKDIPGILAAIDDAMSSDHSEFYERIRRFLDSDLALEWNGPQSIAKTLEHAVQSAR